MISRCRLCGGKRDSAALMRRRQAGLPDCPDCSLEPSTDRILDRSNQTRSRNQEKRAARRYGAKRQKGSGSQVGAKGDLRAFGKLRGECKFTRAESYTLKLQELRKIEHEAAAGEIPAFEIEFQHGQPFKRYVVLPGWAFEQLYLENQ